MSFKFKHEKEQWKQIRQKKMITFRKLHNFNLKTTSIHWRERKKDVLAVAGKRNTRYVWTDKETAVLLEKVSKTNINALISGGGGNSESPPCIRSSCSIRFIQ